MSYCGLLAERSACGPPTELEEAFVIEGVRVTLLELLFPIELMPLFYVLLSKGRTENHPISCISTKCGVYSAKGRAGEAEIFQCTSFPTAKQTNSDEILQ